MDIHKRQRDAVAILDISGEIDLYNAPQIKDHLNQLIEDKIYKVIINLDRVTYIDSSGIGALIAGVSNLKKYNGTLKIINTSGAVRKVLELTKLNAFFEIFDNEDAAFTSFH